VVAARREPGPSRRRRLLHVARGTAAIVRDGWLVLGLSMLGLVAIEAAYRAQGGLRRALRERADAADHGAGVDGLAAEDGRLTLDWSPYVHWRTVPQQGRHVNVDARGIRRTVQPTVPADSPARTIYMLGGSTLYGAGQRDAGTLASTLAARLAEAGIDGVEVVNLGASGYVFTQEVIDLMLRLRAGERPDIVVFYDGINDVFAALQNGAPGLPQNEAVRRRDFQLGRALYNWRRDAAADIGAFVTALQALSQRMQFIERLRAPGPAHEARGVPAPAALALDMVRSHVATARLVEALAREHGFQAFYVWQPTIHTTRKSLTPQERDLIGRIGASPLHRRAADLHAHLREPLDVAMAELVGDRFIDLTSVLDGETRRLYTDVIGHTVEEANGPIAGAILERLRPLLNGTAGRGRGAR
jgi:lysophospholipase L1-like esterase